MNMVMAGDGHSNIYNINSLDYPFGSKPDVPHIAEAVNESIKYSVDKNFHFETPKTMHRASLTWYSPIPRLEQRWRLTKRLLHATS